MPENFDIKHTDSLGLQLDHDIIEQFGGAITAGKNGRTTWSIES